MSGATQTASGVAAGEVLGAPVPAVTLRPRDVHTRFDRGPLAPGDTAHDATCPICASGRFHDFARVENGGGEPALERALCLDCGHIAFSRRPPASWLADFYREAFESTAPAPERPPAVDYSSVSELLGALVPQTARILDVGCGYGSAIHHLQGLGYRELAGLEISERRADVAERLGVPVARCVAEAMGDDPVIAAGGPFDAAYSWHAFEHVYDPALALRNVAAAVRPGGIVMVVVPNAQAEHLLQMAHYVPHVSSFSVESMRRLFARAGLDVLYVDDSLRAIGVRRDANGDERAPAPASGHHAERLRQKFFRDFGLRAAGALSSDRAVVRHTDYRGSREVLEPSHGTLTTEDALPRRVRVALRAERVDAERVPPAAARLAGRLAGGIGAMVQGAATVRLDDGPAEERGLPQLTVRCAGADADVWLK